MNEDNNVLTIKTVQIQPIRNMITAIKDILTDATITFTKDGLKIINFDKTHTILVNVVLNSHKFEQYTIGPDKIIVCANTLHLFKVISTMANDCLSCCVSAISARLALAHPEGWLCAKMTAAAWCAKPALTSSRG